MTVTFNNHFGTMNIESKIRSIFDVVIAGQIATDGNYYLIHIDHVTKLLYALTKDAEDSALKMGYPLINGKSAIFNGENVRAMTFREECLYNEDNLIADVDIWGNIRNE